MSATGEAVGHGMKLKDFGEEHTLQSHPNEQLGVMSPALASQYQQLFDQFYAPLKAQGYTDDQITTALRSMPAAQSQKLDSQEQQYVNSVISPDTWYDKLFGDLALATTIGVMTAGVGSGVGAAAGGGLGGALAGGAAAGATGAALQDALTGQALTLKSVGEGAVTGAATGGLGYEAAPLSSGLQEATGLPAGVANTLVKSGIGAGVGALKGAITGGDIGQDAELGGASGLIKGAVQNSGLTSSITDSTGSGTLGNVAAGLASTGLTSVAKSALVSPSEKSGTSSSQLSGDSGTSSSESAGSSNQFEASTELSPGVAPVSTPNPLQEGVAPPSANIQPIPTATAPSNTGPVSTGSFLGDVGSGLSSTLGGATLGNDLGTLLPYAGVAAVGLSEAKAGQASDAKSSQQQQALAQPALAQSATELNKYNTGTLNPSDQAVVNTGIAQGQDTIASANGLSAIAQTAFANYNSGKLNPGDQAALDAQTAAAKQAVAQQLASAGITDSTILAAQNQNIDNEALISKQNTLNGYFNTGNQAYNSWLTATNEGKATITAAQTYASQSLQTHLVNSMNEANIGIGEVNTAIQTQMTTDAAYAAQVSTLMGTLATAYAKQVAGQKANQKQSGNNNNPSTTAASAIPKISGGGGVGLPGDTPQQTADTGTQESSDILGQNLDNQMDINSSYLGSLTDMQNEISSEIGDGSDVNIPDYEDAGVG